MVKKNWRKRNLKQTSEKWNKNVVGILTWDTGNLIA